MRVEVEYEDIIEDVGITGDFFLQPPEALEELESSIEGLSTDSSSIEILKKLEEVEAELVGFSREDIVECVEEVVK